MFGWVCFSLAVFLNFSILTALILGATLGTVFNFLTHSTITFGGLSIRKVPIFLGVYAFITLVNYVTLLMMMSLLPNPILAQFIVTPFIAIMSYLIFSRLVFAD